MEKLIGFFVDKGDTILAVLLAVVAWSFLQAVIKMLTDLFLVKVFKKKLNGGGKSNGKVLEAKFDELIAVNQAIGAKHDQHHGVLEGKIEAMHDIICEEDENKFPKFRVMEKKVREIWTKVIRGVSDGG